MFQKAEHFVFIDCNRDTLLKGGGGGGGGGGGSRGPLPPVVLRAPSFISGSFL